MYMMKWGENTSVKLGIKFKDGHLYTVQHNAVQEAVQTVHSKSKQQTATMNSNLHQ
jgi:collagenase-like PrtC family protease